MMQDDAALFFFFKSTSGHEKRILIAKQLSSYTNTARQLLFLHRNWAGWFVPGNLQLLAVLDAWLAQMGSRGRSYNCLSEFQKAEGKDVMREPLAPFTVIHLPK